MGALRKAATLSVAVAMFTAVSGCAKEVEADCQPVNEEIRWLFERESQSPLQEIYAVPTRAEGSGWLMAAQTQEGVAVWASSIPPDADGIGIVFPANAAAHADALVDQQLSDEGSTISSLLADEAGIAAAAGCVAGA